MSDTPLHWQSIAELSRRIHDGALSPVETSTMRISVPEAKPTLSLAASLGVTFPFNVVFGIPIYLFYAEQVHAWFGMTT